MGRGVNSLGGKRGTSRQIAQQGDFEERQRFSRKPKDFIPLEDVEELLIADAEAIPAPTESPGDEGSSVPGIEAFKDPSLDPNIAAIFEHIHFPYNSSLIKGEDNLHTLQQIVSYLVKHPRMSVFIEGHCDKRGSAAC
jgi:peptidoglycan-associated lipoprotein